MTFEELGLPEFLVEATERLEWSTPTPIQTITIPQALEGKDILGGAPTGTGKTFLREKRRCQGYYFRADKRTCPAG